MFWNFSFQNVFCSVLKNVRHAFDIILDDISAYAEPRHLIFGKIDFFEKYLKTGLTFVKKLL